MPRKFLRNLQIGFGISLVILLASSTASYVSIKQQINNREKVDHTRRAIASANRVLIDLQNAETGQRGFHLTGRADFLEPYEESLESLPKSLTQARELTVDNPEQTVRIDSLASYVKSRTDVLARLVDAKKTGRPVSINQLEEGKRYMDACRNVIAQFIDREEVLLRNRTAELDRASRYTSIFIVGAAIASLLITSIFYGRIRGDFQERERLQESLRKKDEEISRRLKTIQKIADQIAHGDYSMRVNDAEQDDLGSLAGSLDAMTAALQSSFDALNSNEWRQSGLASLNETLMGNKSEDVLAGDALTLLIEYTGCVNGAFYLLESGLLQLRYAYGLESHMKKTIGIGEGMVGQVFVSAQIKVMENLKPEDYVLSFSNGQIGVRYVILLPILLEGSCIGVIELGSNNPADAARFDFYKEASRNIALAIYSSQNRKHVQTLLEETQAQAEELQTQHAELENLNTELEAQTQKLQASEEELKVQQEELLQSNQELEERSKLLEEKNQLIAERNLEIQEKAEELALSTKYKSEFLANMSHELRTPLNSILLLSRLMAENTDENLNEEQVESAKVIQSSGTSLLSLIDEILDLSKIEAGKMELDYQEVSLSDVVRELQHMFDPLVREKELTLEMQIQPEVGDVMEIDRLRLEQVLRNLLSNAIKFTARGHVSLSIEKDPEQEGFVVFAVKDTGIGIATDKQRIIFEAFQQADGSTRRKFGGTGLGLSISREIARLLGGEIRLESEENQGSTFRLVVPQKKGAVVVKPTTEELMQIIANDVEEINTIVTEERNPYTVIDIPEDVEDDRADIRDGDKVILIVEDDTNFAKVLLKYTRQQGYKGIVIVRGDLAGPAALKYQPLAILLDIQLPVKDGWQVMDEVKSNPGTRHIPVHIMSSLEVKKESLLRGAIDFINKPVALEQIGNMFKKIEDALNRYPKKVLIIEENPKHAKALSYFLSSFDITSEIKTSIDDSVKALSSDDVNCVILDMGVPDQTGYETLETIKKNEGLENLPIIIFTGKNLSKAEELRIKQYADSIVIKTAHSYQRILDEVGLFLHLVEEKKNDVKEKKNKLGSLNEVLHGKTVLIADDDVRNIFSLTKALEKYQMRVVSAIDGKEALEQLKSNPDVSIVLMDMMMPEMDGYETIKMIREIPTYRKLPIMAVTAKAMTGDREKCIQAGASDYISKPVDTDQLLSLLRVWLYEH
ncbi:response regulator [Sphingobacterium suaedae]|uniref:histidine kinase n=1 Tax=Sphingobacterium suaedae TaxID=1686402 RepID=A0ABW5KEF6_9SPHI